MTTAGPNPPITIDILLAALHRSIFHPFIALLLPLCLRALATPYTSPSFLLTSAFAACVCLIHILSRLNHLLTYGSPRPIDWTREVVVITGGCGGLGGCIAEILALRGLSVAVLDIAAPPPTTSPSPSPQPPPSSSSSSPRPEPVEKEGIHYWNVDITSPHPLAQAWAAIEHTLGTPTILINNAAIAPSGPIISTPPDQVRRVLEVNTSSQFCTTRLFLRGLLLRCRTPRRQPSSSSSSSSSSRRARGGTIVTVSSVLGELGAANLAAYCASKAALTAYHGCLRAELRREGMSDRIKTVLVAPGQLDTALFADVKAQGLVRRFAPVVGAGEVARRVVEMVGAGEGGEVRVPAFAGVTQWFGVLPGMVQDCLRGWSGVDEAVVGGRWGDGGGMEGREGEGGREVGEGRVDGHLKGSDDSDSGSAETSD